MLLVALARLRWRAADRLDGPAARGPGGQRLRVVPEWPHRTLHFRTQLLAEPLRRARTAHPAARRGSLRLDPGPARSPPFAALASARPGRTQRRPQRAARRSRSAATACRRLRAAPCEPVAAPARACADDWWRYAQGARAGRIRIRNPHGFPDAGADAAHSAARRALRSVPRRAVRGGLRNAVKAAPRSVVRDAAPGADRNADRGADRNGGRGVDRRADRGAAQAWPHNAAVPARDALRAADCARRCAVRACLLRPALRYAARACAE